MTEKFFLLAKLMMRSKGQRMLPGNVHVLGHFACDSAALITAARASDLAETLGGYPAVTEEDGSCLSLVKMLQIEMFGRDLLAPYLIKVIREASTERPGSDLLMYRTKLKQLMERLGATSVEDIYNDDELYLFAYARDLAESLGMTSASVEDIADQSGTDKPKIKVDLTQAVITVNGDIFSVTPDGADMINLLLKANGEWIPMGKHFSTPARTKDRLPEPLQKLIETASGNEGYRLIAGVPA